MGILGYAILVHGKIIGYNLFAFIEIVLHLSIFIFNGQVPIGIYKYPKMETKAMSFYSVELCTGVFKILENSNLRERWKQVPEILERWKQVSEILENVWKHFPEILEKLSL